MKTAHSRFLPDTAHWLIVTSKSTAVPDSGSGPSGPRDNSSWFHHHHHHHHHNRHLSLSREGRWGITDDFTTSFIHFFSVLHCPLGHGELQACPFPNVVFPPLPLSALSSSPFHCAWRYGFGQFLVYTLQEMRTSLYLSDTAWFIYRIKCILTCILVTRPGLQVA